jgi:hypothetical protein
MKWIDYVIFVDNQYCRAVVGQPYKPSADHVFDYGRMLGDAGIPASKFNGAGCMRLFGRKLMYDYTPMNCFEDRTIRNAVVAAMKQQRIK